jgi:hypothetical protein
MRCEWYSVATISYSPRMSVLERDPQRLATIARSAWKAPKYSSYYIYHLDEILDVMTAMIRDYGRRVPSRKDINSLRCHLRSAEGTEIAGENGQVSVYTAKWSSFIF